MKRGAVCGGSRGGVTDTRRVEASLATRNGKGISLSAHEMKENETYSAGKG